MNRKEFLKPDWRKFKVFIILSISIFLIDFIKVFFYQHDAWSWGIPFEFSWHTGPCLEGMKCSRDDFRFLIIDIVVWYIISLLILWIYDKVKRK